MSNDYDFTLENPFEKIGTEIPMAYVEAMIKKANVTMGSDRNNWNDEIVSAFETQHPEIISAGGRPHLSHSYKDWSEGCGVGAITVTLKTGVLMFPVIIRYSKLAPFDMCYSHDEDAWKYATPDTLKRYSMSSSPFLGVSDAHHDEVELDEDDRWMGLTSSTLIDAGYVNTASLKRACAERSQAIVDLGISKRAYVIHGSEFLKGKLKKLAESLNAKETDAKCIKLAFPEIPDLDYSVFDTIFIKKASINEYDVRMGHQGYLPVFRMKLSTPQLRYVLKSMNYKEAEKILDAIDTTPESGALLSSGQNPDVVNPANYMQGKTLHQYGTFHVTNVETGKTETGIVFPVIDWTGEDTKRIVFLGEDVWSLQKNMHGHPATTPKLPPQGRISPGNKGIFINTEDGIGFSTPPIEVQSVFSNKRGVRIKAIDLGAKRRVNLIVTSQQAVIMPFSEAVDPDNFVPGADNVYLPSNLTFVPLPEKTTKIASDLKEDIHCAMLKMAESCGGPAVKFMYSKETKKFAMASDPRIWHRFPDAINKEATASDRVISEGEDTFSFRGGMTAMESAFFSKIACIPYAETIMNIVREDTSSAWKRIPSMRSDRVKVASSVIQSDLRQKLIEASSKKIEKIATIINETLTPEHMFHIAASYEYLQKEAAKLLPQVMEHVAGATRGVPDATGPYGRGAGPGEGTSSGLGLMSKLTKQDFIDRFMKDIPEEERQKFLAKFWPESTSKEGSLIEDLLKKAGKIRGVPDGTGPGGAGRQMGRGLGPCQDEGEAPNPDEEAALGDNQVVEKGAGMDSIQDGKSSLNTLFNLGLLSPKNIDYLKNKADFLNDAEDFFCKLLMTTRLAGLDIEEDALEASLEAITQSKELIESLGFGLGA